MKSLSRLDRIESALGVLPSRRSATLKELTEQIQALEDLVVRTLAPPQRRFLWDPLKETLDELNARTGATDRDIIYRIDWQTSPVAETTSSKPAQPMTPASEALAPDVEPQLVPAVVHEPIEPEPEVTPNGWESC